MRRILYFILLKKKNIRFSLYFFLFLFQEKKETIEINLHLLETIPGRISIQKKIKQKIFLVFSLCNK